MRFQNRPLFNSIKGSIFIKAENNLKPENIRDGVSIFDVKGTYKDEGN